MKSIIKLKVKCKINGSKMLGVINTIIIVTGYEINQRKLNNKEIFFKKRSKIN